MLFLAKEVPHRRYAHSYNPCSCRHEGVAYVHPFPRQQMLHLETLLMPGIRLRVVDAAAGALVLEAIHEPDDDHDLR